MRNRSDIVLGAIMVVAIVFMTAHPTAAQVVYSDQDFELADWSLIILPFGGGGTADATAEPTGGNPNAWRMVVVQPHSADSDPDTDDGVAAAHLFEPSVIAPYDPAVFGGVSAIFYEEDEANPSSFGAGNAAGPALFQDGAVYTSLTHFTGTNSGWESHQREWMWQHDFCRIVPDAGSLWDCSQKPDLSEHGSPFSVGFVRWNSGGPSGYTIISGIDNWQLAIVQWIPLFNSDFESGGTSDWSMVVP